jgi:putative endonuclease
MYYVYLIVTKNKSRLTSYVGYTNDLYKRIKLHNRSKGAKFTRGRFWKLIYYKKYSTKIIALKEEYKLKKDYNLRNRIKIEYLNNENIHTSSI